MKFDLWDPRKQNRDQCMEKRFCLNFIKPFLEVGASQGELALAGGIFSVSVNVTIGGTLVGELQNGTKALNFYFR